MLVKSIAFAFLVMNPGFFGGPLQDCGKSTTEIKECQREEMASLDQELAEVEEQIVVLAEQVDSNKVQRSEIVGDFKAAQEAWRGFLKRECDFEYSVLSPGTAAGIAYNTCYIGRTRYRIQELEAIRDSWLEDGYTF